MTDVTAPADVALTLAEKEKRVWDGLVEEGRDARTTHDDTNWRIGRAAVTVAELFALDQEGKPDEEKRKLKLKDYATAIGMIDNPKLIYEIYKTAQFWSAQAQSHFKDCTWSAFRECARHGLTLKRASTIMHHHGHEPVSKIRQICTGGRRDPIVCRKTVLCRVIHTSMEDCRVVLEMAASEIMALNMARQNAGSEVELRVTWLEARDEATGRER